MISLKNQNRAEGLKAAIILPIKIGNFRLSPAVLIIGLTGLAFWLSFLYLGNKSVWWDEAVSIGLARLEWSKFYYAISHGEANMSLYYFLLHFWINLGTSELAVRSLSAIFAALTVPIVFVLGSRLYNRGVGALAAVLLTVNPFFIHYAQEARSYSLVLFLASLSSLLLVEAIHRPAKWLWVMYVIASVFSVYAQVFAVLVPAAHLVSLLSLRREALPWKALLIAGAAIILLILPLAISVVSSSTQNLDWMLRPGFLNVGSVLAILSGGTYLLAAFFMLGLIAFYHAIKELTISKKSYPSWHYALLLSWLLVPIIIALAVSQIKPVFTYRYFIICSAPLVLLAAIGISRLPRRWMLVASIVIVLGISGFYLKSWYLDSQKQDWRGATSYILSRAEKGDAIIFYAPYMSTPFNYYRERAGVTTGPPASVLYFNPDRYSATPVLIVPEGYSVGGRLPPVDPALLDRLSGFSRVWLVLSHEQYSQLGRDAQAQTIQDLLQARYGIPGEKDFYGIRVFWFTQ